MSEERDPGKSEAREPAPGELARGVARGERVHAFTTPAITVTWSRGRCTHVGECVMHLPTVFEPGRRPWVDASQGSTDAVARVVMRCPTGALQFERHDGGTAEPVPAANTVLVSRDGPTYLRGDIEVLDEDGAMRLRDTRVALCRCGLSRSKPLCDNSHRAAGFRDPGVLTDEDGVQDPGAEGSTLRVIPHPDGPIELSGPFALSGADRGAMQAGTSAWLCRCGHSKSKPFCDSSHEETGFTSR
jgi:CDGSH-type Zn-finger protein/uncharacterized Fe-S cluster protein YjdI